MALTLKSSSVKLNGSEAIIHILRALLTFAGTIETDIVITSGNDDVHMKTSKHYKDQAVDVRSKTLSEEEKKQFKAFMTGYLGPRFSILLENKGTVNEHFHIQVKKGEAYP